MKTIQVGICRYDWLGSEWTRLPEQREDLLEIIKRLHGPGSVPSHYDSKGYRIKTV